jgi:hypothetical protein
LRTLPVARRDRRPLELTFLLRDVSGTLSERDELLDGIAERL